MSNTIRPEDQLPRRETPAPPRGRRTARLVLASTCLSLLIIPAGALAQTISYTDFFAGPRAPVLTGGGAGAWDEIVREKVVVIQDEGIYKMWYVGHSSAGQLTSKVGYATSNDGINWTKHPGNPIVDRESQDQDIQVLKLPDGTYLMYIEVGNWWIDLLTSNDGISWVEDPANPVKTGAASPVVWREGSTWYLLYESMIGDPLNIHLATSSDGRTWIDSPANPVLSQGSFAVPDSVIKDGDTYHLYYHPGDITAWHATSTDLVNWVNNQRLLTDFSSQYVFRTQNGELWSYVWSLFEPQVYYLRYGRPISYPLVWPLDEGSGTVAADVSGNGLDGTLVGGPTWTTGVMGAALRLDGANDHVVTDFRRSLEAWTIAVWVRSPATPAAGAASGPVHQDPIFQVNWNHNDPAFRGAVAVRAGGNWYPASFGTLAANTWYHLAGTYDGETLRAYRNGVLVSTNAQPSGPVDPMGEALRFGCRAESTACFAGTIDDVRLYDRDLDASEIAGLATFDQTPPLAPGPLGATVTGQTVNLSWGPSSDAESGIGGYRIYRGVTSGAKTLLTQVPGSTLAYSDTATAPNTVYYYEVSAVNGAAVEGPRSNEAIAVTGDVPPMPPEGLTATAGDGQVTLDWADNTEADLAGYRAFRSTAAGGPYVLVSPTLITSSNWIDETVVNDTTYYYVVAVVDLGAQQSAFSNEASATPRQMDATLEGHWVLDEGSGAVAHDSSGNFFDGTLVNGPTWTTGVTGGGLAFDGVNDHVATTYTRNLAAWTVAVWVRSPLAPVSTNASGPVHRDAALQLNWNHPETAFRGAAGLRVAGRWYAASFGPLAANTWYHLAATYDGDVLRAYKDGVLVTSNAAPSGPPDSEAKALRFGCHAGSTTACFAGTIDDVRLYDRALTGPEISALAVSDGTPPLAPGTLTATPSGQAVNLQWGASSDPESGIGSYRIYRGQVSGGVKTLLAEVAGTTLTHTDSTALPGTTYYYEVAAVNGAGVEGPRSNEASATVVDVPPAAPSGLAATASDTQVTLDWSDNTESDLAGYRVHRGTAAGGPYTVITPALLPTSAFMDTAVTPGTTYYYVVTAVDAGNNESALSNEASATVADPPPAAPTGLAASAGAAEISLDWSDNTESDLAGYRVRRATAAGGPYTTITPALVAASAFVDTTATTGVTYFYVVTAVDLGNNESAPSNEASARIGDPPPAAPTGLAATGGISQVTLDWNDNVESDLAGYRVHRSTTPGGPYTTITPSLVTTSAFLDVAVAEGVTYYYVVTAVDLGGNESARSSEAPATTTNLPPAAPVGLAATAGTSAVTLDWNDNAENDLAGYRVHRATTPGGPYTTITTTLVVASTYLDQTVAGGTTYYYVVTAVDLGSNESARSNEASATPQEVEVGLEAHWRLDEGSGTVASDSSGNGWNATLVNGPVWTLGVTGGALTLDGVNDHVATTYTRNLAAWTVAVWVRSPLAPASASASGPVHREAAFQLNWNHPDAAFRGAAGLRVGGTWYAASFGPLAANTWYHLAATYDGDVLRTYKDGVLVTSNAAPSGPPDAESNALRLGCHARNATACFAGTIDEVRIYGRALSAAEISTLIVFDETPPLAPAGLTATPSGQAVGLQWAASGDPESGIGGYRIYRGLSSGGTKTLLGQVAGTALTYTDNATLPATTYYYEVSAVNGSGIEGPRSNESSATTADVAPAAPTGLTAVAGNAQVTLDWADNVESDLAGYRVHGATTAGGPYTTITTTLVTGSAFVDSLAVNGVTYHYVVTAVDLGNNESGLSNQASATPQEMEVGLEGHWRLDDGSGTVASDSSGNGWNGTLVNGPLWTTGVTGGALTLDGVDDHVATTYTHDLPAWTAAVWVRSPLAPASASASGPIHRDAAFQLNWNHPETAFRGAAGLRVGGTWYAASFGPLAANTWYHLAATYDGDVLRTYKDGLLVTSNAAPTGPPDSEARALRFGCHAGTTTACFAGTIDDVRIYGRALTATEISALAVR